MRVQIVLLLTVAAGAAEAVTFTDPIGPANLAISAGAINNSDARTVDAESAVLSVQEQASFGESTTETLFPGDPLEYANSFERQAVASAQGFGAPRPQVIASASASSSASTTAQPGDLFGLPVTSASAGASARLIYGFRLMPTGLFGEIGDEVPIDLDILASFSGSASTDGPVSSSTCGVPPV